MGLSNETQPNIQPSEDYLFQLDQMRVNRLVSQLIKFERNPDPRELPNPAHPGATRVRTINPERSRVPVDEQCKNHNSRAANLGASEEWGKLWR